MMKGQTRLEFIFGIIIFSVLVFYVVSQINTSFSSQISNYESYTLNTKALNTVKFLAESKLAASPYNLSLAKLDVLRSDCSSIDAYGLGSYSLRIYNSTDIEVSCGTQTLKAPRASVSKSVLVRNTLGNITLEIW
jgi:hypothetical protein